MRGRRQATTLDGVGATIAMRTVLRRRNPREPVFSREIRAAAFPQCFRQPTTIVKYSGETDPRVWLNDYRLACQLGGATSDEVIIRNLPPPRRFSPDVARAPARQPDPQLG
jgi:hypothetical protein